MNDETTKSIPTVMKADMDTMNMIHQLVARKLMKLLKSDECDEATLGVAIRFLKENDVTADLESSPVLQQIAAEVVKELPFAVEDDPEEAEYA